MEPKEFNYFFNCFDDAALKIINDLPEPESTLGMEILEPKSKRLSAVVGIVGLYKGRVLIEIQESQVRKLYECAYGETIEDEMELCFYLAEFTNMIAGHGITMLNNVYKGHNLSLTPPALFADKEMDILSSQMFSSSKVYETKYGPIRLEVSLEVEASVESALDITTGASPDLGNNGQTLEITEELKPKTDLTSEITNNETGDLVAGIINGTIEATEDVDPEFLNDFLVETREHIENIEMNVLALETDPDNMEMVHSLFRSFHTIKGLAGFVNQELVRAIAHQTETQLDKCRKGELKVSKYFVDLILASSDYLKRICDDLSLNRDINFLNLVEVHLKKLKQSNEFDSEDIEQSTGNEAPEYQALKVEKLGEILVGQGLSPKTVEDLLHKQEQHPELKFGQVAVKEKKAEVQEIIKSLRIQEKASKMITHDGGYAGYTRVPTAKIDSLVDMIGELIIIQSLAEREAVKRFDSNDTFVTNLLRMEKITKEVQNVSMSLRMVSMKSTFQKINRIGRDTIAEVGKDVNLVIQGEETEIDRGITEKILDPLLHLVKNAISHGIEEESERVVKGKPAEGQVSIRAYSKRGSVYIEVADDGQGLSLEKIYQKAIVKNLIDPSQYYSDEEIINLIFLPGLSTAEIVDNVSGRGVGLDVVKTEISKIGGKVEVNNRPGAGCTFTLKIPINLAAINGTIVDIQGSQYIIPTLCIKQIVKSNEVQWISISGNKRMIRVREELIPLIPITKLFDLQEDGKEEQDGLIIVLELEQVFKAITVRNVVERREVVVKPIGSEFSQQTFLAGASILGDGRVSLILDIENLYKIGEAI